VGSIKHILWLAIFFLFACNQSKVEKIEAKPEVFKSKGKGSLFIIGGGKRSLSLMEDMVRVADLQDDDYVLVMSQSSSEPDTSFHYVNIQLEEVSQVPIIHVDSAAVQNMSTDSIIEAKLIYITGGDQNRFLNAVPEKAIEAIRAAYEKGATTAGTSAGAALMSSVMITGDQKLEEEYSSTYPWLNYDNGIYKEGLGLLDSIIIDQHFVARSRYNRIISAMADKNLPLGAGIDESTALVVGPDFCQVMGEGQVLIFERPEEFSNHNNRIGFRNLKMHSFLPGDTINLNELP
jgi:cyanophycinase